MDIIVRLADKLSDDDSDHTYFYNIISEEIYRPINVMFYDYFITNIALLKHKPNPLPILSRL